MRSVGSEHIRPHCDPLCRLTSYGALASIAGQLPSRGRSRSDTSLTRGHYSPHLVLAPLFVPELCIRTIRLDSTAPNPGTGRAIWQAIRGWVEGAIPKTGVREKSTS